MSYLEQAIVLEDVYFSALTHLSSGQFGLNDSLY
jgi:hypothetical protein